MVSKLVRHKIKKKKRLFIFVLSFYVIEFSRNMSNYNSNGIKSQKKNVADNTSTNNVTLNNLNNFFIEVSQLIIFIECYKVKFFS